MTKNAISLSIAALSLSLASIGFAHAQSTTPQESYQEAMSYCNSLMGEARVSCQRDAHAAHHNSHHHPMSTDKQNLEQNRIARCNRLPESQRQLCIEHMQGKHQTQVHGSVRGGGVLRQSTIEIPGEPYEVTRPITQDGTAPAPGRVITPIN